MDIKKDLAELKIDTKDLKPKYKSLEGSRHIIQYESENYVLTFSKTFKPKLKCVGITNRCENGQFVLFMDYDKIYKKIMLKNIANLQKIFPERFGNFYIATTEPETTLKNGEIKGSYHVVNFSKHYKEQIETYLKICDVDPYFIEIPKKTAHKCHVLRIMEKVYILNNKVQKERPKFLMKIPESSKYKKPISQAHYKIFRRIWGFPYETTNYDDSKKVEIHEYSTLGGLNG